MDVQYTEISPPMLAQTSSGWAVCCRVPLILLATDVSCLRTQTAYGEGYSTEAVADS